MRAIKRVLPPGDEQLVLFIDQLEELFTLVEDEGARTRFLAGIEAVVKDQHSARPGGDHAAGRLLRPSAPLPGVRET